MPHMLQGTSTIFNQITRDVFQTDHNMVQIKKSTLLYDPKIAKLNQILIYFFDRFIISWVKPPNGFLKEKKKYYLVLCQSRIRFYAI